MIQLRLIHCATLGLSMVTACGSTTDDHESPAPPQSVGAAEEPIINGIPANTQDLPALGVVSVTASRPLSGGGTSYQKCSGVLLSNRWVLTAGHCVCQSHVTNPSRVTITNYGSVATGENAQLAQLYTTTAAKVIPNTSYDVALIQLNQTLPFYEPPFIYKASGGDLKGKTVTAWGFGDQYFDSHGEPAGFDERLNWAVMQVDQIATTPSVDTTQADNDYPCDPKEILRGSYGPVVASVGAGASSIQQGDSGGPLFLEPTSTIPDLNQRVLIGVLSKIGKDDKNRDIAAYTGLWVIRDWIRTSAPDLAPRSACPVTIPNSMGAYAPAVAEGPDGAIHIVAVQSNGVIGHWRFINGVLSKWGNVVGTSTSHAPAIGLEPQAVGLPRLLGLAYREKTTGKLKYVRWSSATWTAPIDVPNTTTPAAPAMGKGGIITYLTSANRVAATAYDPASNTFAAPQLMPTGAPTADPSRRLSVVEDLANGVAEVGYRTTANEWVQAYGSFNCFSLTGSFWCNPDPKYGTDWQSAALAWVPGQRINLLTTRRQKPTDTFAELENRVVAGPPSWFWGKNRMQIANEPGVAQVGFDTFIAAATSNNGLTFSHGDNCFANDW